VAVVSFGFPSAPLLIHGIVKKPPKLNEDGAMIGCVNREVRYQLLRNIREPFVLVVNVVTGQPVANGLFGQRPYIMAVNAVMLTWKSEAEIIIENAELFAPLLINRVAGGVEL